MTNHSPTRNHAPEPVRPWFARLFRRPSSEVLAAEPPRFAEAGRMAAEGYASGIRQAESLAAARTEAARWKRHADSYDRERAEAEQLNDQYRDEIAALAKERDGAYRERAQLLAWLAALHPATTVITQSPDVDEDGWQLLYLVAGGWQMSWHVHPRDADLFKHVTVVDVTDPRAQWDGHGTEQKYERIRNHVRLLALNSIADGSVTGVTTEQRSA